MTDYAQWAIIFQEYEIDIIHRAGSKHANAGACFWNPLPTAADNGARRDLGGDDLLKEDRVVTLSAKRAKPEGESIWTAKLFALSA